MPYVTTWQYREIFLRKWQPPMAQIPKAGVLHSAVISLPFGQQA